LTTLTQSSDQSVNTWIGCLDSSTGYTYANSYWRAFNAADYGIGPDDPYSITSVDVGIFTADAGAATQPLTVNLYTTANFPAGFPASLTLIGTTTVQVADQSNALLNVPISAEVPAGTSQIILEIAVPDGVSAQNIFMMGGNTAGETGPSYITAPSCEVTTPITNAEAGFPAVRWVMNINGSCSGSNSISGKVTYAHVAGPVRPVPGTALNGSGLPAVFQATGLDGSYNLSGFGEGSYTITPSKPNVLPGAPNGIFANDAALIARHVVGLTTLNATQQAAARVSGGTQLSSVDAAFIARWVVGLNTGPNETGQWKFTPENRVYTSIVGDQTDQDYSALLMGDVNGDWNPPAARPTRSGQSTFLWDTVAVSVPDIKLSRGNSIVVPLRIGNLMGSAVSSFQFDVEFDPAVISPAEVAADLTGTMGSGLNVVSNSPRPGLLKVAVYGVSDVYGDGSYVNLMFRRVALSGSSPVTITGFRLNDGTGVITTASGKITLE
jgi:hypothetical protein